MDEEDTAKEKERQVKEDKSYNAIIKTIIPSS